MSVPEQVPYKEYRATGSNNSFEITFYLPDPKDLVVMVNKEIPLVGAYSIVGDSVVFSTPPNEGDLVELTRDTQLDRETKFKSYDNSFRPETINFDLDKIWLVLQESNLVDAKILARLKQEIEWRRTHDFNYDELAQVREKQLFDALKGYADTLYSATNPNVFAGVIAGVVFARDGKSIQTHLEDILHDLATSREDIGTKAAQKYVDEQLDLKANSEDVYQKSETYNKAETYNRAEVDSALVAVAGGNYGFNTLAAFEAAKATIPVNSTVTIAEAGANQGQNIWDGTTLAKSPNDPLLQAKQYTDSFATNVTAVAFTVEGYISATGSLLSTSTFKSTDFIKVTPGEIYRIYSQIAGVARHAWYDKNKVFISAFGEDQTTLTEKTYTAPLNAAYVRVSAYQPTAWNVAYIKSKAYNADVVQKIIQQHMPQVDASKINYNSSNVKATLDTVISKQDTIIANQNGIIGQLDLMTDKESPYFVNTSQFVKSVLTPTNFNTVNVTARVSNTQMTVSDATAFIYSGSCVVHDPTANSYTSHNVIGINGTTITVMPPLPENPTQVQTMHDETLGQHLSLYGYKGLADHILSTVQKYGYKKAENLIFRFNASLCAYLVWNNSDIYNADASQLLIPVTKIGTAGNGGYTPGTTNLAKICAMSNPKESYQNIGVNPHTQYLSRAYHLVDGEAGNGFEISFNAQNSDGFIEIPLAVRDELYISSTDSQQYRTNGKARLQVFNGSTIIHDAIYAAGQVHHVFIDFAAAETLKVRVTCETSVPTWAALSGIFAYKKSAKTSKEALFRDGDVIAFLGDSWTQYPIASTIGETGQTRPDGSVSTGSQWLSRRMREKLLAQGKNVTMLNMGFGGQTSRWGKYWVNTIINLDPKPTHCVLCFYINDANSVAAPENNIYDFDPVNMFANKLATEGGVSGKISSYDEWEANIKWLCDKLIENGIKPIVIMPSQTAAPSQAQRIRIGQLDRLADGFD
ncbi:hypothetical protein [Acinetobacter sp. YH12245]|uniref:hypothetical protein n=1 Tax=Acinetobacter sp. YH12245 TaxID=2601171 RepID=UPI0015D28B88|nr:hypothetical protein [Acinetobacter sp. YH12245]